MNPTSIYGKAAELEELRQLLSKHRSFLLYGPAGVGKTLLLKRLAGEVREILYCGESSSSQTVFRTLASELIGKKNRHVVTACGKSGLNAIKGKSAVSLRGMVTGALRGGDYLIVLDHVHSPAQGGCRILAADVL